MELLYFKGHPPNFGDELNWYIFESMFVESDFKNTEPKTYFMGVGSILHPAYLELFAGEKADTVSYWGRQIQMNKAVVFGSGVRCRGERIVFVTAAGEVTPVLPALNEWHVLNTIGGYPSRGLST